jgi:two-component system, NtrC family, sensor kinase
MFPVQPRERVQTLPATTPLEQFRETAGTLAQEIGGPLTAIEIAVSRLRRHLGPDAGVRELAVLEEQSRRLTRLSRSLVAFARPARPRKREVDVNQAVKSACALTGPDLEDAGIRLEIRPAPEGTRVRADPHHLREVLLALLANARLAVADGGGGGWIRVESTLDAEDGIRVRIRDSGPGIRPGETERIFLPFVSGWNREGLGLALARLSMLLQGGELEVEEREEGAGAEFTVRLPGVGVGHEAGGPVDEET